MAAYHSIHLQHFRSYDDYAVEFDAGVNIIVGPNGSGKTNLLEALYVLSTGSSFRGQDRDLLKHGEEWFRLEGYAQGEQRIMTYRTSADIVEKQYVLDGTKKARLTHGGRVPVVLFEPDHLRLVRESPAKRREYIDHLLVKLHPDISWVKHQFERVLAQRNAMLKRRLSSAQLEDQLFAWDIKFAELAEQLVLKRQQLATQFNDSMTEIYSKIAKKPHQVRVEYHSSVPSEDYRAGLLKLLHTNLSRDADRGFTGAGPHRDDFTLYLDDSPAAASASRGEMRSLLLGLKIIELRLLADQHDSTPLLLLDDVFSELDAARRQALAELAKSYQTLITTTDADAIVEHFLDGYKIIATERQ